MQSSNAIKIRFATPHFQMSSRVIIRIPVAYFQDGARLG